MLQSNTFTEMCYFLIIINRNIIFNFRLFTVKKEATNTISIYCAYCCDIILSITFGRIFLMCASLSETMINILSVVTSRAK